MDGDENPFYVSRGWILYSEARRAALQWAREHALTGVIVVCA